MNHINGLDKLSKLTVYKTWGRLDDLRIPRFIICDHHYINGICINCLNTEDGNRLAYLREKELGSYADI